MRSSLIECSCHGSTFAIVDGTVKEGPAWTALPERKVTHQDGRLQVTKARWRTRGGPRRPSPGV
ncbi:Rieske (2Fe-2S) protein [Kitasatospora sp. NPDC057015]|uniref:Rieske (2Fe-2S) protein n=1 Tax=Kitasatospora sp. NPDC057015 TaxID=3346001 RepID=UPI0036351A0F